MSASNGSDRSTLAARPHEKPAPYGPPPHPPPPADCCLPCGPLDGRGGGTPGLPATVLLQRLPGAGAASAAAHRSNQPETRSHLRPKSASSGNEHRGGLVLCGSFGNCRSGDGGASARRSAGDPSECD